VIEVAALLGQNNLRKSRVFSIGQALKVSLACQSAAAFWMDVRKLENSNRTFGPGPTTVWSNFRKIIPFRDTVTQPSFATRDDLAVNFLRTNSAASLYPGNAIAMPIGCPCH